MIQIQGQMAMMGVTQPQRTYRKPSVIYEPAGRAQEYRELACNLYRGCDHRCTYCYAPSATRRTRADFVRPVVRKDILKKLENDAGYFAAQGESRQVMFCFACDPYQHLDVEKGITRQAIKIMHRHGLSVCILTKGGRRALRDLGLMGPMDSFATTLTTLTDSESLKWEPGAALPEDRFETLKRFHEAGIPTWVSLEPVLNPATSLELIRRTSDYVDHYKVGTLNHHPLSRRIDWARFARQAKALLEDMGQSYYLKKDLKAYLR